MTTPKRPRRIRVCQCPHCGGFFKWQRRAPTAPTDDEVQLAIQICPCCFMCHDGDSIPTTLERPEDYPHIK